ncbi:MAG TPA: alpha/beta fold hydrolase [Candidatus Desulfobacillus sp.]|nr:alpha/beta fold hydrolase [Candidatus Desulfobacillus sp.]
MNLLARLAFLLPLLLPCHVLAQDAPPQQVFASGTGGGPVVVMLSGRTGAQAYAPSAQKIADAGFNVVLVDANELYGKDTRKVWTLLRGIITRAQANRPGKVGVVGYSLGGGLALAYAARMPDLVATVVLAYPATSFVKDPADFIAKTKVPVHIHAGVDDSFENCCLIGTARQLAQAAAASPPPILTLTEYPGVGHGFNLPTASAKELSAGEEAMNRTIAQLKQALAAP